MKRKLDSGVGIKAGISNYIHDYQYDVIIHPCFDFNGGFI